MKGGRLSTLFLMVTMLALCVSAWGQATTSLHGTVTDPSGAAIANAKVTLSRTATNASRDTTTNSVGAYSFPAVLPGTYSLTVTAMGFDTYTETGLELLVSLPATGNVQMKLGSVAQTVEVGGHAPLLNTTDASIGHTMDSTAIENLPMVAESMPLLLSFQPGVVFNGQTQLESSYDTRAGSVNGERSDQNNITLDGVSDNDEFEGFAFNGVLPTTPFSTQEFRVTTSNYDATQGRSAGAQMTMVTKSGTNQFHGNLYEFNRNTIGEANDWFLKASQVSGGQPNRPTKLVRNVFGGDLGGPFLRDRLFFFFNYEGHRQSTATSAVRNIPSATLRDGIIEYACADAAITAGQCPGGGATGSSGSSYSVPAGYYALNAQDLQKMDPLGIGPSQVALQYFQTYPEPNAPAVVDAPNFAGYRFASPVASKDNWYIGRLDYTINSQNILFLRATVVHDRDVTAGPFLPGSPAQSTEVDFSKGLVAGYTRVFGPALVNNFRYGLTRGSVGTNGDSNQPWVEMRDLDQDISRTTAAVTPVHNFIDTMSWQHGSHAFQFGANILAIRRNDYTDANSYSDALTNADWTAEGGFANTKGAFDPEVSAHPAVSASGAHAYDFPLAAMIGMASEVDARYNYQVTGATTAAPLNQGAPVVRHWSTDTYNLYFQDTWQARHGLSITYGLNYQLMTPITETHGQQVEPNVNMGDWFNQRARDMAAGVPSSQDAVISFEPAGSQWGRSGMYGMQTKNFAPRVGVAWAPGSGHTVVRGGFGMYYDNFGPELAMNYDAEGSFGISTVLENPANSLTIADAPRITGMNTIPTMDNSNNPIMEPAPPSTFPVTYPLGAEAIATGIDQSLKTPYSYAVDLSIQRELPGRMMLDVGYVGHYGHRELALDDIAAPLDLKDPATGIDYFAAATAFAKLYRQGVPVSQIDASTVGPTAAFWTNMFSPSSSGYMASSCAATADATDVLQAAYAWMSCKQNNETSALYDLDVVGHSPAPVGGANSYYNSQFSSLWTWRSMANSNYHALQVSLHKEMSHGVTFGFNYTYSHSLDIASFAERAAHFLTDSIINPWNPHQMYGPSDFDLRHQINAYWVAGLPFGKGEPLAGNAHGVVDGLIGGWQLAGTTRWNSGFPFSVFMGYVWPTNWDEMGWANQVKPVSTGTSIVNGSPNVFKDPNAALNSFDYAYPGQSGQRNNIRGDGFLNTDMNLSKSFKIMEKQSFQVRWQVFNTFNTHRFDVQTVQDEQDAGGFGSYTELLTAPRTMEFSGVYTF